MPKDPDEAQSVQQADARYTLIGECLYKRSFSSPLLMCLSGEAALHALEEVHESAYRVHEGEKALVEKVIRAGLYQPTMRRDAHDLVSKCNRCQYFSMMPRCLGKEITAITSPWPFAQWGIDPFGPLPMVFGGRKFVIMTVNYFTKWVEAEALAKITEEQAKSFVWKNILTRFGVPRVLVSDNGTQFTWARFAAFCEEFEIQQRFTSVAHPQCNGQTEMTN